MSSASCAPPLSLELRPSRLLLAVLGAVHGLAGSGLWACGLPAALKICLGVLVGGSFGFSYALHHQARSRWFIERVCWSAGSWMLRAADGTERTARLIMSYSQPGLVILIFGSAGLARRSVVVLPDSADRNQIRRLRVYLRTSKQNEENDGA